MPKRSARFHIQNRWLEPLALPDVPAVSPWRALPRWHKRTQKDKWPQQHAGIWNWRHDRGLFVTREIKVQKRQVVVIVIAQSHNYTLIHYITALWRSLKGALGCGHRNHQPQGLKMSGQRPGFIEFTVNFSHTPKTLPRLPMCSNMFKHSGRQSRDETWGPFQTNTCNYQTFVPAFLMLQKMTPINAMPKTPTFGNLSWGKKMSQSAECWRSLELRVFSWTFSAAHLYE